MITLAQYQGTSWVSWCIKTQTRSIWSHSAAVFRDDTVVESWHKVGVDHVDEGSLILNLSKNHSPGTTVDLFHIDCTKEQADIFEAFLLSQKGMPYDFPSVLRFVTKKSAYENGKWFCSELFIYGTNKAGVFLLVYICPSEVSPQLLGISPEKIPMGSIITI